MIQDLKDGGLKMIDAMSTLKCEQIKWIKEYLNNTEGVQKTTIEAYIGLDNLTIILRGNYDSLLPKNCTLLY